MLIQNSPNVLATSTPSVRWLALLLLLAAICLSPSSWAQDEEEGETAPAARAIYIPLKPPFVVNYGGVGRLRYLKAELSVRVASATGANSIRHHMPYIRNQLILLFSKQTEETLDTQEGKEMLRQEALQAIHAILEEEDGESELIDVYFNQLVLQK
ncbi:MAG: flagellar basal body rod protein [Cellvibrionaceae bacterium]|nr:flagellar basal body rod protein [Cellvibrionaceae bacterium]|tara:strand:+ start:4147 stop:4614 length:468 start_codon:yes stop_codon:yes gene_type:complete